MSDEIDSSSEIIMDFESGDELDHKLDLFCQRLTAEKNFNCVFYEDESGKLKVHGRNFDPNFEYSLLSFPIPELKDIEGLFDRILAKTDGFSLQIHAFRLRRGGDNKPNFDVKNLREIFEKLLTYTGVMSGNKMPVVLNIFEITNDDQFDFSYLKKVRSIPGLKKVGVNSWGLNFRSKEVWTNIPLGGILAGKGYYRRTIEALSRGERIDPRKESGWVPVVDKPILTFSLIGFLIAIFGLELWFSKSFFDPSISVLVSMGGVGSNLVLEHGEWYRLVTAAFLHGGYLHIILNCVALYFGGVVVEFYLGRKWFFAFFILSAIGGSLASIAMNSPDIISVGASGAIMGLVAAALVVSAKIPYGQFKTEMQTNIVYILVPGLFPLVSRIGDAKVDFGAHLGGAVTGLILAGVLYFLSNEKKPDEPPLPTLSYHFVGFSILILGLSSYLAVPKFLEYHKSYSDITSLMPKDILDELMASNSDPESQTLKLIELDKSYPKDPRIDFMLGTLKTSIDEKILFLGSALDKEKAVQSFFPKRALEKIIRIELGEIYQKIGNMDEAIKVIEPICDEKDLENPIMIDQNLYKMSCGS